MTNLINSSHVDATAHNLTVELRGLLGREQRHTPVTKSLDDAWPVYRKGISNVEFAAAAITALNKVADEIWNDFVWDVETVGEDEGYLAHISCQVLTAAAATAEAAGPLPENIEDMPDYMRRWFELIRAADPMLAGVGDGAFHSIINMPDEAA